MILFSTISECLSHFSLDRKVRLRNANVGNKPAYSREPGIYGYISDMFSFASDKFIQLNIGLECFTLLFPLSFDLLKDCIFTSLSVT